MVVEPPPEPTKSRPPSPAPEPATPAAGVAESLSRHDAVSDESARGEEHLAAAWQGSAAEEEELARVFTRAWKAARTIVHDPALFAALREQNPGLARQAEVFAEHSRDELIAWARRQMPQPSPEPEPEPEPETPTLGMRM